MTYKEYLIDTVGEEAAKKILSWDLSKPHCVIIKENNIPATGKTTLSEILLDQGIDTIEEWMIGDLEEFNKGWNYEEPFIVEIRRTTPIPKEKRATVLSKKRDLLFIERLSE